MIDARNSRLIIHNLPSHWPRGHVFPGIVIQVAFGGQPLLTANAVCLKFRKFVCRRTRYWSAPCERSPSDAQAYLPAVTRLVDCLVDRG
jgi:hypothetical protein